MAKREYLTFVGRLEDLAEDRDIELLIKDLAPGRRKYDARYVRAHVRSDPATMPEGDLLWIRGFVGVLHPRPWAISIIRELGPFPPDADFKVR